MSILKQSRLMVLKNPKLVSEVAKVVKLDKDADRQPLSV